MISLADLATGWNAFFHTPEPPLTIALFRILFGLVTITERTALPAARPAVARPRGRAVARAMGGHLRRGAVLSVSVAAAGPQLPNPHNLRAAPRCRHVPHTGARHARQRRHRIRHAHVDSPPPSRGHARRRQPDADDELPAHLLARGRRVVARRGPGRRERPAGLVAVGAAAAVQLRISFVYFQSFVAKLEGGGDSRVLGRRW